MRSMCPYVVQQGNVRLAAVAQRSLLQACATAGVEKQGNEGLVGAAKMLGCAVYIAEFSVQVGQVVMRNDQRGHTVIGTS
jgi:Mn2+/Fe2+ NRAMP family transporter